VRAVVTGQDFAAPYGVIPTPQNEYPMARDKVRYRGEPLVAVAAIDDRAAEAAMRAITFDIEELPAYFTTTDARSEGAVPLHESKPGNVERKVEQDFGDVDAQFPEADLVLERSFIGNEVYHGQIELDASVAGRLASSNAAWGSLPQRKHD
jgi:4-hydroxybenzoyl-CoA reductase subunit alpha